MAAFVGFGGLHSPTLKDWVQILLNGNVLDGFELQYKPQGHTDFFHQVSYPDGVPKIAPFSECENVYPWPIPKTHLVPGTEQELTICLDRDAKWDIDFLGFLFELPPHYPRVFISYNANDKILARRLTDDLNSRGIGVWIDDVEIKLGDSLLQKIAEGIEIVEYLLVLISRHSITSAWVNKEVEIAMTKEIARKRVKVFAVLVDDVELPTFLKTKQYADLRNLDRYNEVVAQIQRRVAP